MQNILRPAPARLGAQLKYRPIGEIFPAAVRGAVEIPLGVEDEPRIGAIHVRFSAEGINRLFLPVPVRFRRKFNDPAASHTVEIPFGVEDQAALGACAQHRTRRVGKPLLRPHSARLRRQLKHSPPVAWASGKARAVEVTLRVEDQIPIRRGSIRPKLVEAEAVQGLLLGSHRPSSGKKRQSAHQNRDSATIHLQLHLRQANPAFTFPSVPRRNPYAENEPVSLRSNAFLLQICANAPLNRAISS